MNIAGLKAQRLKAAALPHTRQPPAVKRGYGFEDKVGGLIEALAAELGWVFLDHPWFDHNQPDFVLISPSQAAVVFEVKLTWTPEAVCQLARYSTLLAEEYHPITQVVVARNLTPVTPPPIVTSLLEISNGATVHLPLLR